jgi:ubiquinone/menaquinone biosynthesis C-methylase UbiE
MATDIEKWLEGNGEVFLKDIGIRKGQLILDFGCGVGHYTIPAAKAVGKVGKVYALDKDRGALDKLMQMAESEGLRNIFIIRTSGDLKIDLKDESIDRVLLYDVLHYMQLQERKEIYNEVYRILKIDGLLLVYPKHHMWDESLWNLADMELEDVVKEIESANFYLKKKCFKTLIHDDNYDKGFILNFIKKGMKGNCFHDSEAERCVT